VGRGEWLQKERPKLPLLLFLVLSCYLSSLIAPRLPLCTIGGERSLDVPRWYDRTSFES
jgi:hypothetical protein